jgi:hypothetical protein
MQQRHSATHPECWPSIQSSFTLGLHRWRGDSDIPCSLRDSRERRNTERENAMKTRQVLKASAAPAAVFCALAFFTMATPATAAPVDYCRTDTTSGMRGCGFPAWSNARRCPPAAAAVVSRIHSPRAAALAAMPMPISRSTRVHQRSSGSRLTNKAVSLHSGLQI